VTERLEPEEAVQPPPLEDHDQDPVGGSMESRFIRIAFGGSRIERTITIRTTNERARMKANDPPSSSERRSTATSVI
jgi:hypothetical protein